MSRLVVYPSYENGLFDNTTEAEISSSLGGTASMQFRGPLGVATHSRWRMAPRWKSR
jgi:hypothetical protein